jgi:hypothetical protein
LTCADGELFLRFERSEDFKKWNVQCHFKISTKEVGNQIADLEEKLAELKKMQKEVG